MARSPTALNALAVSSTVVIWGGIALLAVAAFRRRATRDAERLRAWGEEEERRAAALDAERIRNSDQELVN